MKQYLENDEFMKYLSSLPVDVADVFSINLFEGLNRISHAKDLLREGKYEQCEIFLQLTEDSIFTMAWINSFEPNKV